MRQCKKHRTNKIGKEMKIEDITQSTSAVDMVEALKKRATPQPEIGQLKKQYFPQGHRIFDTSERPDKIVRGADGEMERFEKVARIALPLQRVIVERAVAFLFGHPVKVSCAAESDRQAAAFEAVKRTLADNKIDSLNRRLARTVMWETEAAELWYPVAENGFWEHIGRDERFSFVREVAPQYKLRVALFNPSQGDRLYPMFDNYGDMTAFSRGYTTVSDGQEKEFFETYTDTEIVYFERTDKGAWQLTGRRENRLGKIPVVYARQDKCEWADVQGLIERLEKLLSNFADTNDYHASPKIFVTGEIRGFARKGETGAIIEGEANSTAQYLSWQQAPESVRLEISTLLNMIYSTTQTPDISFESVKGLPSLSGVALRMLFLDAHLKVQNKSELFGEYLERRMNIVKRYLAVLNKELDPHVRQIEVCQRIEPFMVDDRSAMIQALNMANGGRELVSQRTSVRMAGLSDDPDGEYERIIAEKDAERITDGTLNIGG